MNLQRKVVSESCLKMALGRGKLISVIGDEDTCVGNKLFFLVIGSLTPRRMDKMVRNGSFAPKSF